MWPYQRQAEQPKCRCPMQCYCSWSKEDSDNFLYLVIPWALLIENPAFNTRKLNEDFRMTESLNNKWLRFILSIAAFSAKLVFLSCTPSPHTSPPPTPPPPNLLILLPQLSAFHPSSTLLSTSHSFHHFTFHPSTTITIELANSYSFNTSLKKKKWSIGLPRWH